MEVFSDEKETIDNKTVDRQLLVVTENGLGKRTKLKAYPVQKRSGMGVKVADVTKKTGLISSVRLVKPTHKQLVIGTKSGQTIKMPITKNLFLL